MGGTGKKEFPPPLTKGLGVCDPVPGPLCTHAINWALEQMFDSYVNFTVFKYVLKFCRILWRHLSSDLNQKIIHDS